MSNDADTVTPLDGEDGYVTGVTEQFEGDAAMDIASDSDNVSAEDYSTRGQTTVATRRGYAFVPSDKNVPVVTAAGIQVTKAQAEQIVGESNGRVHIVEPASDENTEG